MNGLTKVFVVLVTFLSVVLVALIVPFVNNTEDFKQRIKDLQGELKGAQLSAQMRQVDQERASSKVSEQLSRLESESAASLQQINELSSKLVRAENALTVKDKDNESFKLQIGVLSATAKQYADITGSLQKELKDRRSETLDLQTRLIELSRRNNDLEEQSNTLARNVRASQEQMASLEEEVRKYSQLIARLPSEQRAALTGGGEQAAVQGTAPVVPSHQIRGAVTQVEKRQDDTFVQINVGTRDGVEPNMKFWVHRGDSFVGTLVVTKVDANAAAGRMQLLQGAVASGDLVLTGGF